MDWEEVVSKSSNRTSQVSTVLLPHPGRPIRAVGAMLPPEVCVRLGRIAQIVDMCCSEASHSGKTRGLRGDVCTQASC